MGGSVEHGRPGELEAEAVQVRDAQDASRIRQAGFLERLIAGVGSRTGAVDGDRRIAGENDVAAQIRRRAGGQAVAVGREHEAADRGDGTRVIADGEDAEAGLVDGIRRLGKARVADGHGHLRRGDDGVPDGWQGRHAIQRQAVRTIEVMGALP